MGLWDTPARNLGLFDDLQRDADVIELGCGTASVSAWLARMGARPVAVDFSRIQIEIATSLQREHGLRFPLIVENAEAVRYEGESFDLAFSEYGVSLWSDPDNWLPEANRLLRLEGVLVFLTNSSLLLTCTPPSGGMADDNLVRDYFGRYMIEFEDEDSVEFHLTHGDWIEKLRKHGFVLERLIEVRPQPGATPRLNIVTPAWARRWPSEDVWVAQKVEHLRP